VILADVNLLVYAFDADAVQHPRYAPWLTSALSGPEEFALLDTVLSGFVRIVTHPGILPVPAPTAVALSFVDAVIHAPAARWLHSTDAVWLRMQQLADGDDGIRGNLIPDAYLAAAALTHGARLATADRGFARYPRLNWFDPAA
jgi:uncharacterized protein